MNKQRTYLDFSLILASSVHDMKNSVGMLLNSLDEYVDQSEVRTPDQARQVATLQYEASRINSDLIQLLSIYRLQTDRLPLQIEEHFVEDLLTDQIARNQPLFDARGIAVSLDCDPDLHWYFDEELIAGVINNILVNCARYTQQQILLSAHITDNLLCLSVADDGGGYPAVMLEEPLALAQGEHNNNPQSTNMGLYFASQVAALHRQGDRCGEIQLINDGPLGGGQFSLYLP